MKKSTIKKNSLEISKSETMNVFLKKFNGNEEMATREYNALIHLYDALGCNYNIVD